MLKNFVKIFTTFLAILKIRLGRLNQAQVYSADWTMLEPVLYKREAAQPLWVVPLLSILMKSNELSYEKMLLGLFVWGKRQEECIRIDFRH